MKRRTLLILICGLLLGAGAVLLLRARHHAATAPAPTLSKAALTVVPIKAQWRDWPTELHASGSIAAWQEASIGADVSGLRLIEVNADVGQQVHKDQVLARFARDSGDAAIAQAQAALDKAVAAQAKADSERERAQRLRGTGAISDQDLATYNSSAALAAADVGTARAELQTQRVALEHTTVLAPDNGIISSRSASLGAVIQSGSELFRLIRGGRLEWRAEVPERDLASLQPGMAVSVQLAQGQTLNGRVRLIAPTVDTNTRNALVYVDLPSGPAKAGMYAQGRFLLRHAQVLTVPEEAVVVRDGFSYVFRIAANHCVQQLKVNTGLHRDNRIEVQGPSPGDQLVGQGAGFLSDGDMVRVGTGS